MAQLTGDGRKQILITNTKKKAGHLRGGGGAHPLYPPPGYAPVFYFQLYDINFVPDCSFFYHWQGQVTIN